MIGVSGLLFRFIRHFIRLLAGLTLIFATYLTTLGEVFAFLFLHLFFDFFFHGLGRCDSLDGLGFLDLGLFGGGLRLLFADRAFGYGFDAFGRRDFSFLLLGGVAGRAHRRVLEVRLLEGDRDLVLEVVFRPVLAERLQVLALLLRTLARLLGRNQSTVCRWRLILLIINFFFYEIFFMLVV